ncbi:MAG: hypothetical protein A3F43_05650 [Gammaproteobacteria bacterium RIFCSPHIGHO2_12_FULL_42_10]|nr:MAG: hypothetical protein A3F43_05650 [Gammaproteobacteria bacterium RIFCSPHIGHO2_12_FULL_42_10]
MLRIFSLFLILCCILFGTFSPALLHANFSSEGIQVYQKSVPLLPENKKTLAEDISRYHEADNLWDALREDFALQHYENHPAVQEKIDWYMNNQDFLQRSANRAAPYLYYILQQIKKRHLPAEIALLPIVESGYNPFSLSIVGAAGIWQLMPGTASDLGIQQNGWYDGRRDVIASTRGALNHLKYLESVYEGNWLLAFAAYNTGEGNVRSALLKNIRNGRNTDFWSLPVAAETRGYVPSILALAVIISHPHRYHVAFPPVHNAPYLAQIDVGTQINLKYAASLAGMSLNNLQQLNPGYNRSSTPSRGPFKLTLPMQNVERFTENLAFAQPNTRARWMHYQIKSGDSFASLAKKFNTSPTIIRQFNQLRNNHLEHGTDILIPASTTKSNQQKYSLLPGDTIYIVRKEDSLISIAKNFHITIAALRAANINRIVAIGKPLIIPTHTNRNHHVDPGDTIYMVRPGDTIDRIAKKFHLLPADIRLANLIDDSALQEGEHIVIPARLRA